MGFGIVLIGYALLLFEVLGIGFVGYVTIAYGCYLLSRTFRPALVGSFSSLVSALASVSLLLNSFSVYTMPEWLKIAVNLLLYISGALTLIMIFLPVARLALEYKAFRLRSFTLVAWYVSMGYYVLCCALVVFNGGEFAEMFASLTFVYKFLMLIMLIVYFWYCYASVTTPELLRRQEREEQEYAEKEERRKKRMRKLFGRDESEDEKDGENKK